MTTLFERVQEALAPDYELEQELASGGMGIVFAAREPALKRRVAVKVLRPELATATAAERFRREGETLARAAHPNVVTVHKADERAGISFLVTELFRDSLADRLRAGPLPEAPALRMTRRLLEGLGHVHELGIVHRDVKPGNIFFRGDTPVLGDFGIARSTAPADETLTGTDQHPGTLGYMAPEQLAGREVTPAADLYAAGATLYEMLTGRRWTGVGEVRRADWSGVRGPVAHVLQRALVHDPRERWPDAETFAGALRTAGRSAARRSVLGLGAMTVVVLIVVAVFPRPRPIEDAAIEPIPPAQIAVLPFRARAADSAVAQRIAHAISAHLEYAFTDGTFRVTPMQLVMQWWKQSAVPETLPGSAFGDLRAARVAWGRLERDGDRYRVVVELHDSSGVVRSIASRSLEPGTEIDAGFALAYEIVADIEPRRAREFQGWPVRGHNSLAVDSLMAGDRAFWRENWAAAERLYRAAIALDSTLGWASWGLYNVERWRRVGFDVDLRKVQALYPSDFRALDPLLIAADLQIGLPRLAGYEAAARAYPNHASPWLLMGNELFHRGPLWGIGLDSAVAVLRVAAARDPYMAPVFSTMAWALIRLGRDSASREALDHYTRLASRSTEGELCLQCVIDLARTARFAPQRFDTRLGDFLQDPGGVGTMVRSLRWGLSFGVPEAQVRVSGMLADIATSVEERADAMVGRALGLVALGRVGQALADLDSAARLAGSDELALQAAQWRVVFPAVGLPGVDSGNQARGLDVLQHLASPSRGGSHAARARWSLAIDAFASGDATAGRRWGEMLDPGDSAVAGLRALTAAYEAAARGDTAEALRRAALPAGITVQGRLGDPLARAVLQLARGSWLSHANPKTADQAWLWYENSDAEGWPGGPPQAAELDWALETWGRYLRAALADATGDRTRSCALLPDVVHRWKSADPSYTAVRARAAALLERCTG
jgi:tRNA A-37 threonylcarbamoyl transferase component Bud32/tetratricopeptide (TPR) repeat protein